MTTKDETVATEDISYLDRVVQNDTTDGNKTENDGQPATPAAPDGGWGWVVVFGSFMIHVIADGIAYSFGVYVEDFKDYFDCNSADVGMLGSLVLGVTWGTGPIASIFTNKYGCRSITIAGTLIAAFGFIISIFAPNIIFMYFSFGIVAGFGLGLTYLPAIVAVSFYFEKRRSLATGLAVCGSGFGTFIFAPLTNLLLEEYSWKGTILIETGLLLNCILCGAVFRPMVLKPPAQDAVANDTANSVAKWETDAEVTDLSRSSNVNEMARLATSLSSIPHQKSIQGKTRRRTFSEADKLKNGDAELLRPGSRKDIYYPASLEHIPMYKSNHAEYMKNMTVIKEERADSNGSYFSNLCSFAKDFIRELRDTMDISLLWDVVFMLFAISNLLTSIGYCVPYIFLPDRAVKMDIADKKRSSFLVSIIGMTNTIGRIVFGWIADFKFVNRLMLYNTVLVLCGIASLLSSLCTNYVSMGLYSACFGLLIGVYTCLTPIVLVDLLGLEKLSNSFGLVLLFQGIGAVVGPPMAGAVYDRTKNYDDSFYLMGICIAISGLMLYPLPCVRRMYSKKVSEQESALGKAPNTAVAARADEEAALQLSPSESVL